MLGPWPLPQHFKKSTTVVLRKPGKDNYTMAKSYRPIALLNTVGKTLDAILARRISYVAEAYQLLPTNHLGGRKATSTEHAAHLLIESIYASRPLSSAHHISTILSLDVSGAFDYVSHIRLQHNLRKRQLDPKLVKLIGSFLQHRTTTLHFDNYTSKPFHTNTGIPQGSPLSPILYLFYNADLLESCNDKELGTSAIGYIDDINIIVHGVTAEENCAKLKAIYTKCQEWERRHASKFNPSKYCLLHIARGQKRVPTYPLILPEREPLHPSSCCRFLGIILDSKLNWNQYIQHIQARATRSLTALASLSGSTWGIGFIGMRQIYSAVILPQMLYGCSTWFTSTLGDAKHNTTKVRKLATIQARAARNITEAFKATSTPALDIEAFLPMKLQLTKAAVGAFLRIASSPLYQRIQEIRDTLLRSQTGEDWDLLRSWWTPLEKLQDYCSRIVGKEVMDNLETIIPHTVELWRMPPGVTIDNTIEAAEQTHNRITTATDPPLAIYTDGSSINGKVGAAAVAPQLEVVKTAYMGKATDSTVYVAELEEIRMAMDIAAEQHHSRIAIFTDNQAALRAIKNSGTPSGQYILLQIMQQLSILQANHKATEFYWIPAHRGTQGNEAADKAAKEATGWREIQGKRGKKITVDTDHTGPPPPTLKHLRASTKLAVQQAVYREWEESWAAETRGRSLYRLTPKPTKGVLHLHKHIIRPLSSIITQMRTGKIGLRQYLHSRHVPDITDGQCGCRRAPQTVAHVLLACRRQAHLRDALWKEEDERGKSRRITSTDIRHILNTPAIARKAASILQATGLLRQFRSLHDSEQVDQ
jgi:ribonuclease HI